MTNFSVRIFRVTFRNPFTLPSVGAELPAGSYEVKEQTQHIALHGISKAQTEHWLIIEPGVLAKDDYGCESHLLPGELDKALAADRADARMS